MAVLNQELQVVKLRCEYQLNPLGIDVPNPRLSWQIQSAARNVMQSAYRIQVSIQDDDFVNIVWDSGKVVSEQSLHVPYDGELLQVKTRYYFRVKIWAQSEIESAWSEPAFWEMGLVTKDNWVAQWITPAIAGDDIETEACPLLRTEFKLKGQIKKARIYATALGLYELYFNGVRVGDYLLTPGWTTYSKRLQYQTYDVTKLLSSGANALGAILGNGWYKGTFGFQARKCIYGDKLAFLLQLELDYEDGSTEIVVSDTKWKTATGPICLSEIYDGEIYDARLEKCGWDLPGYADADWNAVVLLEQTKEVLVSQENEPVKAIETVQPRSLFKTPKGETVLDFGQNMVGWVRFVARGPAGATVTLKHAEVLDQEGNFYTDNLRNAKQTIRYILKGEGVEQFEPHFTFQGFRYVKVEEYPGEPNITDFTGIVIHSAMEPSGRFECGHELVNQLQHNILWGQKGNFVDVPTDCPQRDERLGWTGDAQVFAGTACFNMNTARFFAKWLHDLKADQRSNGSVPVVIPDIIDDQYLKQDSACGWADAAVIVPWTLYLCYGDRRILQEQYDSMKAYVEYIKSRAANGLLWNCGFHFGDWLALDAKEGSFLGATPNDLTATAYYAYSTGILAKTAVLLGKTDDAACYEQLHQQIVQAFRKEFFTPSGRLAASTQTAHVLALSFNLVAEQDRQRTINTLVQYLEQNSWHLSTGFLGTPYLCHALSANGRVDVAYKLLLQNDFPSWLYQITKGATTIWEHWDGIKPDGSFWSAEMNSFNHYAYGAIGGWLYQAVAGLMIDEGKPAYGHIVFTPHPCSELGWASAELESPYGLVKIKWQLDGCWLSVAVTIPPNTNGSLTLPYTQASACNETGLSLKEQAGGASLQELTNGVIVELGSGQYSFRYSINRELLPVLPGVE
jgi:alpha-L-rhamnosidase